MNRNHWNPKVWRSALLTALPVTGLILYLFYFWFAIADRYFVFLYYHDMGPRYPDTSPFSLVTSSRYWMAGLVAGGAVMLLYAAVNCLLGRLVADYHPPEWRRVWLLCAGPLLLGLPLLTTTVNQPTLPAWNAAQVTLVTLIGLTLALLPGKLAAERPGDLVLLAFDGLGLMFVLLYTPALEDVGWWLAGGRTWYLWMMGTGYAIGFGLLLFLSGLRVWLRSAIPAASALLTAGLCVAYLLMPLVHHLSFTDGYYYISGKDNFFARSDVLLQVVTWLLAAGIAWGVTWLRHYLAARRAKPELNRGGSVI